MSKFFSSTLKRSLEFFLKHPKLILPKLFIAFLYSVFLLEIANLTVNIFSNPASRDILVIFFTFFVVLLLSIVDILVSGMYPFMVKQIVDEKKISFSLALENVFRKASVLVPAVLAVEIVFMLLIVILAIPFALLLLLGGLGVFLFSAIYVLLIFAVVFLFYPLFPVIIYENISRLDSLKRSISVSFTNKKEVTKATLVSFVLSLLSFAIAFSIEVLGQIQGAWVFWAAFVIIRFLTAYVYSYLYVLNPVFYLDYVNSK